MIIFFCIIQIFLSILIGSSIVFSKSNANPTSSITNNFTGGALNSKSKLNLKPRTKLMFLFLFFFFANSIFLTKQISLQNKKQNFLIKPGASELSTKAIKKKNETIDEQKQIDQKNNKIPF